MTGAGGLTSGAGGEAAGTCTKDDGIATTRNRRADVPSSSCSGRIAETTHLVGDDSEARRVLSTTGFLFFKTSLHCSRRAGISAGEAKASQIGVMPSWMALSSFIWAAEAFTRMIAADSLTTSIGRLHSKGSGRAGVAVVLSCDCFSEGASTACFWSAVNFSHVTIKPPTLASALFRHGRTSQR